jgi:tRNA threonylcarbamoyladenosine biosynthesis protein TsaE
MNAGVMVVKTRSEAETVSLGKRLGELAKAGWVIGLSGDLGAGKTTFTRGLAEGAGADPAGVTSPTFTFLHVYAGRIPVYHLDLYRLDSESQVRDLGVDEFVGGDGVAVVEWFENVPALMTSERLEIRLKVLQGDEREIAFAGVGPGWDGVLGELAKWRS